LGGKQSVNGISKLRFGSHGGVFFGEFCVIIAEVAMTPQKDLAKFGYESNFLKNASFHIFG
jgi:hypothetical protein